MIFPMFFLSGSRAAGKIKGSAKKRHFQPGNAMQTANESSGVMQFAKVAPVSLGTFFA
ncbi:MAG TPA: hypothetical protein VGN23_02440 [Verrucomicrobiae bacterium]|jgi:hypothetical protein